MSYQKGFAQAKKDFKPSRKTAMGDLREILNQKGYDVGPKEFKRIGKDEYVLWSIRTGGPIEVSRQDQERLKQTVEDIGGTLLRTDIYPTSQHDWGGFSAFVEFGWKPQAATASVTRKSFGTKAEDAESILKYINKIRDLAKLDLEKVDNDTAPLIEAGLIDGDKYEAAAEQILTGWKRDNYGMVHGGVEQIKDLLEKAISGQKSFSTKEDDGYAETAETVQKCIEFIEDTFTWSYDRVKLLIQWCYEIDGMIGTYEDFGGQVEAIFEEDDEEPVFKKKMQDLVKDLRKHA